jgi:hypothetical protein
MSDISYDAKISSKELTDFADDEDDGEEDEDD